MRRKGLPALAVKQQAYAPSQSAARAEVDSRKGKRAHHNVLVAAGFEHGQRNNP
jgi:hypothetical protein